MLRHLADIVQALRGGWSIISKRLVDLLVGGISLVLALPTMAIIACVVKLTSAGPILERQERMGRNGNRFQMLKFRTIVDDDGDLTRLGSLLRRTALNELPQLLNVLRGDMSLIGPRPACPPSEEIHKSIQTSFFHRVRSATNPDSWLKTSGLLIPKQYREPMLGDLIEDRAEMRNRGLSRLVIAGVTIIQLLVACAYRPKLWLTALLAWLARAVSF